ncbi:MAG: hypothetical protein ABIO70_04840 [Pseudomonadota bacterium]
MRSLPFLFLGATLAGCGFDENLPEIDFVGRVIVPKAAATRTVEIDGVETALTDIRFIGPVWLGAYPSITTDTFPYPHPEMGPVIDPAYPGNTYPYGGGSVGRFGFACFESVACRVTTGRFENFDKIIEYFEWSPEPVTDQYGEAVESATFYEQYCLDYFYDTELSELDFLAVAEDGNGEFVPDLDFEQITSDHELASYGGEDHVGDFVADFHMSHVVYYQGMAIWGFVDNPSQEFTFSTCRDDIYGPARNEYNEYFMAGGHHHDILNYPSLYIMEGDWVVRDAWQMQSTDDEPVLVLGCPASGC